MKVTVKVEGLKDLDKALGELPKATGRNALRRVLKRAGQPIADKASSLAPDDPKGPAADLHRSIMVSPKIRNTVGHAEFSGVLKAGGSIAEARSALRAARRDAKGKGSFAEMYVGPESGRNAKVGVLQEFGTINHPAQPFMRPAWDTEKNGALRIIKSDLGDEIAKAAKRLAKKRAKAAAKG